MKKMLAVIAAVALTVSMACIPVSAHCGRGGRVCHSKNAAAVYYCGGSCSFIDEDGDGICDNCENRRYYCEEDCAFIDEDGDGLCDTCGNKGYYCGKGCAFADEDRNGICDNCGAKGVCSVKPKAGFRRRCRH